MGQESAGRFQAEQIGGAFEIVATAKPGVDPKRLIAEISEEVAKIAGTPPTQAEVERAVNAREAAFLNGLEPTLLSQHLAVLKRHHVVSAQRVGNSVIYELAHPKISELLVIARAFLADVLGAHRDHLEAFKTLPPLGHDK